MHYISELRDGSSVREIYLCKKRQSLVTRAGKNYESLTFQDKTGTIDAKIWDPDSMGIGEFGEMDYAEVSGEVITFQGHLQLNVRRARLCHEGEYDPANYLPVSDRNIDDMFRTILKFVDSIENPYLNRLLKMFFVDDPEFVGTIGNEIDGGINAESATQKTIDTFYAMFDAMDDPYFKGRAADIKDVGTRILHNLLGVAMVDI